MYCNFVLFQIFEREDRKLREDDGGIAYGEYEIERRSGISNGTIQNFERQRRNLRKEIKSLYDRNEKSSALVARHEQTIAHMTQVSEKIFLKFCYWFVQN